MPTLPEKPMPDTETYLLPQRAYLLSYRDQALPARRVALRDSRDHFAAVAASESRHEAQLGLLGLIGDAMQAVEDVGTIASAMMIGLPGLPFYVRATVYDPSEVNNFFAQIHKRDPDYFLRLCGFRFEGFSMHEFFELRPPLSEAERAAFDTAEGASAKLVAEHLGHLAREWERYRRFFHAYKHASLVANPDDVEILDEEGNLVEGIVIWARRRDEAAVGHHATLPLSRIAEHIESVGKLAIDMAGYLVATRLGIFDVLDFKPDGSVETKPLQGTPWEFWMRREDIGTESLDLLGGRGVVMADLDSEAEPKS